MKKLESIQEFYTSRHRWIPDEIKNNIGHFNVFPLEPPHIGKEAKSLEYGRREWYNIVSSGASLPTDDSCLVILAVSNRIPQKHIL
jgi:hypothetical protein